MNNKELNIAIIAIVVIIVNSFIFKETLAVLIFIFFDYVFSILLKTDYFLFKKMEHHLTLANWIFRTIMTIILLFMIRLKIKRKDAQRFD